MHGPLRSDLGAVDVAAEALVLRHDLTDNTNWPLHLVLAGTGDGILNRTFFVDLNGSDSVFKRSVFRFRSERQHLFHPLLLLEHSLATLLVGLNTCELPRELLFRQIVIGLDQKWTEGPNLRSKCALVLLPLVLPLLCRHLVRLRAERLQAPKGLLSAEVRLDRLWLASDLLHHLVVFLLAQLIYLLDPLDLFVSARQLAENIIPRLGVESFLHPVLLG